MRQQTFGHKAFAMHHTSIANHGAKMKMKTLGDKLSVWERRTLRGDFSRMPRPFRWEELVRFAHFLNGYEEAGGFDELAQLSHNMSDEARKTGHRRGSAGYSMALPVL